MKTSKIVWLTIFAIVSVFVLVWGGFALSVALSGPKGVGDAIKTKNSAKNWTDAQAGFEDAYQAILSADRKIAMYKEALAADPKNPTLQTNLTGVTSICISAVADYNADSNKYLKEEFKSARLPYEIDSSDPTTDCK
jgi:hypothetical protein